METIFDIKQEQQNKLSKLFEECGVFFAFSKKQFNENKTPLYDGEKYVSIFGGGYVPEFSVDKLISGMEEINKWEKGEIEKMKNGKEEHILYELKNHECFYTGNITDVIEYLPYTKKEIELVYHKYKSSIEF